MQEKSVDVLLWDNASTDGTQEWACENSSLLYGQVLSNTNILWTPAINNAVRTYFNPEKHRFVGWANNDVILTQDNVVTRLCQHLAVPKCGIIAPMMPAVGGPQEETQYTGKPKPPDGWMKAPYVLGAFVLMRAEVWQQVGFLAEDMPLGADDHDYAIRIREAGYECRIARDVWINHVGHQRVREPRWVLRHGMNGVEKVGMYLIGNGRIIT